MQNNNIGSEMFPNSYAENTNSVFVQMKTLLWVYIFTLESAHDIVNTLYA